MLIIGAEISEYDTIVSGYQYSPWRYAVNMTRPGGAGNITSQYGIGFKVVIEMAESGILFSAYDIIVSGYDSLIS